MTQYVRVFRWAVLFIMVLVVLRSACFSDDQESLKNFSDIFANKSTTISLDQRIGTLMVTGGDAKVEGIVTDGIIVVDGNLIIDSGARVTGRVIVLGGSTTIDQGAISEHKPWVIMLQEQPLVPVIVGGLLLMGAASLILLPVFFWIIGHYFKKSKWYLPAKEKLLAIEQRWPVLYIVASLGVSVLMLTAFGTLAWETLFRNKMVLFDDAFVWIIRYFANPALDQIMIRITDMGFGTGYFVIVSVAFLLIAYLKYWRKLGALTICLAGGGVLNFLLKNFFQRTRPDVFRVVQETSYSFPSGHALITMCFYGMIAYFIIGMINSWRGRLTVMTLTVILILAIGMSRIYLGVHYPTDVLAGYAVGSMWLAFCISFLMWWERGNI